MLKLRDLLGCAHLEKILEKYGEKSLIPYVCRFVLKDRKMQIFHSFISVVSGFPFVVVFVFSWPLLHN